MPVVGSDRPVLVDGDLIGVRVVAADRAEEDLPVHVECGRTARLNQSGDHLQLVAQTAFGNGVAQTQGTPSAHRNLFLSGVVSRGVKPSTDTDPNAITLTE